MTLLTDAPAPAATSPFPAAPRDDLEVQTATVTVTVPASLDVTTLPRVRDQLEQALAGRPRRLVVDLSACAFVDASALAVLLDLHRRMSRTGAVLTLRGACPRVLRLLSLTGLRRVFDLV
jgi:anti-anti-sigma factor